MHVCTVTIALHLIFYFFSLPFTSLSLFLSSASHSHLTDLRSKLTLVVPPLITTEAHSPKRSSKLTRQNSHCAIADRAPKLFLISGFLGFDPFLFFVWTVLGFSIWSVGFGILILFYSLFDQWVMVLDDGDWWWCWVNDGGWVGWWCVWIDRWWWLRLCWVCERVPERSVKMNILLNKCVE